MIITIAIITVIVVIMVIIFTSARTEKMIGVAPGYAIPPCRASKPLAYSPVVNPFLQPSSDCIDDLFLAQGERPPESDILKHSSVPDHVELIGAN